MRVRRQAEFLSLPFRDKLDFLYGLPARQKRDLILASPEAERLVRSFSPETLFYTLKEIGSADAGDLLSLAHPEQVRSLFDLDCWNRDRPDLGRMREWIEAMAEAGRRQMADGLMELDLEMVSLLLRQYIRVYRLDDPAASPDMPSNRFVQFDEHHLIEFIRYDAIQPSVSDFLEEAFERDYNYFTALMDEVYWGVEAELEEQAYQFRRARLSDRGFPDFFEAQNVFAYVDPRRFLEIRDRYEPPSRLGLLDDGQMVPPTAAPVARGADNSLFQSALTAGFSAQGIRQVRSEVALVSNQVLVAQGVDFGDLDAVRRSVEMTHGYLNLGLEHLAGGDLETAVEHLRETHLKLLFRLGVSITIDLRERARQVVKQMGLAGDRRALDVSYLDSPLREGLAALLARRPQFHSGVDNPGAVEVRDFHTMREIHLGYAMLEQIETLPLLFSGLLGIDVASPGFRAAIAGSEIRLSQILLTALVRAAIDSRLTALPVEPDRLGAVHEAVISHDGHLGRLRNSFRRLVESVLAKRLNDDVRRRGGDFVNSCLNMLEEELAELPSGEEIDPRFIRSLLVRRA